MVPFSFLKCCLCLWLGVYNSVMECLLNTRETLCSATTLLLRSNVVAWGLVRACFPQYRLSMQCRAYGWLMIHPGETLSRAPVDWRACLDLEKSGLCFLLCSHLCFSAISWFISSELSFRFKVWRGLAAINTVSLFFFHGFKKIQGWMLVEESILWVIQVEWNMVYFLPPPHSKFEDTACLLVLLRSLYCLSFFWM